MRSFRGVRVLIAEKLVYYFTFAATAALLRFAVDRATWAPAAIRTDVGVELVSLFTAGIASYPFELLRCGHILFARSVWFCWALAGVTGLSHTLSLSSASLYRY
jgi:hypothetical protein